MKVLIAEDSLVMRAMLRVYMDEWHYEYHFAEDGESAWNEFQSGDYHLVLTDWIMPGIDGLELTRRIRGRSGHYVYVILLTSKSEKVDLVQAMEAGADDFLVKPCDKDELRVRLRAGDRVVHLEHSLLEKNRTLRETQAALVQSEQLASLGQLAAGMAHEINNPIAYVNNNISVLKRDVVSLFALIEKYQQLRSDSNESNASDEQRASLLDEIERLEDESDVTWMKDNVPGLFDSSIGGLQRVRDIVSNLRDFARLDEASLDKIDLNQALTSIIEILRHEIETAEVEVERDFQSIPLLLCRPDKINQVFHNVIINAIQASQSGGKILLRTRHVKGAIEVQIEDKGGGISPEHLPHILEPFFTTRPVGAGTGLGLAVAYGIVRDHEGSIKVDSELGTGTLVRITLPLEVKPRPSSVTDQQA